MATIKPYPSLSSKGYIYSIADKTDRIIAAFFASDTNQDYIFSGGVSNLTILLQQAGHDMLRFCSSLRSALEQYLGNLYDSATVTVWDDTATNQSNRVNVTFSIEVTEGGQRYDVANLLTLIDGKFEKITKLNNTGNATLL